MKKTIVIFILVLVAVLTYFAFPKVEVNSSFLECDTVDITEINDSGVVMCFQDTTNEYIE